MREGRRVINAGPAGKIFRLCHNISLEMIVTQICLRNIALERI